MCNKTTLYLKMIKFKYFFKLRCDVLLHLIKQCLKIVKKFDKQFIFSKIVFDFI